MDSFESLESHWEDVNLEAILLKKCCYSFCLAVYLSFIFLHPQILSVQDASLSVKRDLIAPYPVIYCTEAIFKVLQFCLHSSQTATQSDSSEQIEQIDWRSFLYKIRRFQIFFESLPSPRTGNTTKLLTVRLIAGHLKKKMFSNPCYF